MHNIDQYIRNIPDFPVEGVGFKDITTLLKHPQAFKQAIEIFYEQFKNKPIDVIACIESRGFFFGSVLAYLFNRPLVPIRKAGKLPAETAQEEYSLEYGKDAIEIHKDAIKPGNNVLIIDDLLATGGTAAASCRLIEKLDAKVFCVAFLIELTFLQGREKLKNYKVYSVVQYDEE